VVLTTHDLGEARAADHVLLMKGRVVASGPPDQVLTTANLEAAYGLGALHEAKDAFFDDPAHQRDAIPADVPLRVSDDGAGQRPPGERGGEPSGDAAEDVDHRDP
jgi:ABC-type cobalamin/Fe3+-siderophores transport system ATPase subunit